MLIVRRYVPESPFISVCAHVLSLITCRPSCLRFPITADAHFFGTGRAALMQGMRALGLKPGDAILVPALMCGTPLSMLEKRGFRLRYYRVDRNLAADLESIKSQIDEVTKAVLVVHYFGFPQPLEGIIELANSFGLFLVEDCAHAFLSRAGDRFLGTFGDVAIYSLRKSLPVPDGGVLLMGRGHAMDPASIRCIRIRPLWRLGLLWVYRFAATVRCLNWLDIGDRVKKHTGDVSHYQGNEESGISTLTVVILNSIGHSFIHQRRHNYKMLVGLIGERLGRRARILFPRLPEGVVPMALPVVTEDDSGVRLVRALRAQGVGASLWPGNELPPAVTGEAYPVEAYLSRNLIQLPVHQNLGPADMRRVATVLGRVLGSL